MGKFSLGQVVATKGALAALTQRAIAESIKKHVSGDWGNLGVEDKKLNDLALQGTAEEQGRIFSKYNDNGIDFYIITEWDRSYTTVLLPEDY